MRQAITPLSPDTKQQSDPEATYAPAGRPFLPPPRLSAASRLVGREGELPVDRRFIVVGSRGAAGRQGSSHRCVVRLKSGGRRKAQKTFPMTFPLASITSPIFVFWNEKVLNAVFLNECCFLLFTIINYSK
jgi:hypothetical protein